MRGAPPLAIVETPAFLSAAAGLLDEEDRDGLVDFLARNPVAGDLIQGTGGVRKLRWRLAGRGKRGGARVIYFYHDPNMPMFLLTMFAKNVQADISQAARNDFRRLTRAIAESYGRK